MNTLETTRKKSKVLASRLPRWIKKSYPLFVNFIEAYFEWLEQTNQPNWILSNFQNFQDVDKSFGEYLDYLEQELMFEIPKTLYSDESVSVNRRTLIKNIIQFYKTKGTKKSFKFLFRILYNTNVDIEYPNDLIFKPSSSVWNIQTSVRCSKLTSEQRNVAGKILYQVDDNGSRIASARVSRIMDLVDEQTGIEFTELFINDISGNFVYWRPCSFESDTFLTTLVLGGGSISHLSGTTYAYQLESVVPYTDVITKAQTSGSIQSVDTTQKVVTLTSTADDFSVDGFLYNENGVDYNPILSKSSSKLIIDGITLYPLVTGATVIKGGTGHEIDEDVVVYSNDAFSGSGAKMKVDGVGASGEILKIRVIDPGILYKETPILQFSSTTAENILVSAELGTYYNNIFSAIPTAITEVSSVNNIGAWSMYTSTCINRGLYFSAIPIAEQLQIFSQINPPNTTADFSTKQKEQIINALNQYTISNIQKFYSASAVPLIGTVYESPGSYEGLRGILGGNNKIRDNEYYQSFSYVIRARKTIDDYRDIVKRMVHPAGFAMFGKLLADFVRFMYSESETSGTISDTYTTEDYEDFTFISLTDPDTMVEPDHPNVVYDGQVLTIKIRSQDKDYFANTDPAVSGWILTQDPDIAPSLSQRQYWRDSWNPDESYRRVKIRVSAGNTPLFVFPLEVLYAIPSSVI